MNKPLSSEDVDALCIILDGASPCIRQLQREVKRLRELAYRYAEQAHRLAGHEGIGPKSLQHTFPTCTAVACVERRGALKGRIVPSP